MKIKKDKKQMFNSKKLAAELKQANNKIDSLHHDLVELNKSTNKAVFECSKLTIKCDKYEEQIAAIRGIWEEGIPKW